MQRSGIICSGAWCVDRNITVDHWPERETVATIQSSQVFGGCPGHNMSTALKRLGVPFPVEGQGLVGDDEHGRLLASICDELGIIRSGLQLRKGIDTSLTYAIAPVSDGRRTHFFQPGSMALLSPDDFDFSTTICRIAHLGLPGVNATMDAPWHGDASGWVTALKKAKTAGLKTNMELVSIAPEKTKAVAESFLPLLDTLIINDAEVGAIAGMETVKDSVTNVAACKEAMAKIMAAFPLDMITVHFPAGGLVFTRKGEMAESPSVKVPQAEIKGSNGAGDCFAAGILFGHHEGWPIAQSLKLAHASAAMSLRSATTTGAVMNWKDCLAQADAWGWRA